MCFWRGGGGGGLFGRGAGGRRLTLFFDAAPALAGLLLVESRDLVAAGLRVFGAL